MLRLMLNSHPELAVPHETLFLIPAWKRRARFGDLTEPRNRERLARWVLRRPKTRLYRLGVDKEELRAALEDAPPTIGSVLGTPFLLYAERQGKPRWGDKRPSYAQNLDAVFAMFPDAQFVNVVRDPRAVALSVRNVGWYDGDVVGGADLWRRSLQAVDRWRRRLGADQLFEIQYEELVHDPRRSLERIAAFLGLSSGSVDAMLRFHENTDIPKDAAFHPRVKTPVTTEPIRAWEDALAREEVAFIEHALAGPMQRYGYEAAAEDAPVSAEMVERYRRLKRRRALKRGRRRLDELKLRLTYRHPVASQLGPPGDPLAERRGAA